MENQEEVIQQLKKLKQISNAPEKEIDLEKAALLLLQFNRNKILYDNITKRKLYAKLKYEARKTFDLFCARLGINSDSFEEDPGAVMEEQEKRFQAIPPVEELEKTRGITMHFPKISAYFSRKTQNFISECENCMKLSRQWTAPNLVIVSLISKSS